MGAGHTGLPSHQVTEKGTKLDIAPRHAIRSLRYIQLATSRGGRIDRHDIDAYSQAEFPKAEEYGTSIHQMAAQMFSYRIHAAEPVFDFLNSVGWVYEAPGGDVHVTSLGEAVLDAELDGNEEEPQAGAVLDVVLDPENPLAMVDLVRRIRDAGAGMVVDPYFKADTLKTICESTTIKKILVKKTPERTLIGHALHELSGTLDRLPEVRFSKEKAMHDRCIISENGHVNLVGGSINGVGVNLTSIIHPSEQVQRFYRNEYEKIWDEATAIEPTPIRNQVEAAEEGKEE